MKKSLLLLLCLFSVNCSSSEPDDEIFLGDGFFTLNGRSYEANNATYFVDGPYLTISLSNGRIIDYGEYTEGTKEQIWFALATDGNAADLPTTTYPFPQLNDATPAWRVVGGSLGVEAPEDDEGYVWSDSESSFYADFFDTQLSGSFTLSKEGDDYQIDFSMPQLRTGESLSGSYRGKLERVTTPAR